jgi:hypothetical protein
MWQERFKSDLKKFKKKKKIEHTQIASTNEEKALKSPGFLCHIFGLSHPSCKKAYLSLFSLN